MRILFVSFPFMTPAGPCFLCDKLDDIIFHYLNYLFTHPVSAKGSYAHMLCVMVQNEERFFPAPPH